MVNKYYQKDKEKLWKGAHKRYENFSEEKRQKRPETDRFSLLLLSEEEQEKNCQYHYDWNKNLSEEEKQKRLNIWKISI